MCIIIACEPNHRPTTEQLENCFWNNPDGAGVAYSDGKTVHVRKGLMAIDEFLAEVAKVPADAAMVIHCRIGTSGGMAEDATHPFPLSKKLEDMHKLEYTAKTVVFHNGVLPYASDAELHQSDSMTYVMDTLYPLSRKWKVRLEGGLACSDYAKEVIGATCTGSRICVLDNKGNIRRVGTGWLNVTNGVYASNSSYSYDGFKWYKPTSKKDYDYWYGENYGGIWYDGDRDSKGYVEELIAKYGTVGLDRYEEDMLYSTLGEWYGYESADGGQWGVGYEEREDGSWAYHLPLDCDLCPMRGSCEKGEPECPEVAVWCELNEFSEGIGGGVDTVDSDDVWYLGEPYDGDGDTEPLMLVGSGTDE